MKALCLVMVGVVVLAGCASTTERDAAMATARRFLDAVSSSDTGTACGLLTPHTRESLVVSEGRPCRQALPTERLTGTVETVDTWSDQAVVNTSTGSLFLTEFDAGWLVSAAGCQPEEDAPYRCAVGD